MLKKHHGGIRQLDQITIPEKIDDKLNRFYHCINQIMVGQLFEKFEFELDKLIRWLLRFANRNIYWQSTKPYELHKLADYNISLSEHALLEIEVTVEATIKEDKDFTAQKTHKSINVGPFQGGEPGLVQQL